MLLTMELARATEPPIVFDWAPRKIETPSAPLLTVNESAGLMPIQFPDTVLKLVPAPLIETPEESLPEITFGSAAAPGSPAFTPIRFDWAPPVIQTPLLPFPTTFAPVMSTPIRLPATTFELVPVPPMYTP